MRIEIKNVIGVTIHAFDAPDGVTPERALGLAAQDAVKQGVSLYSADLRGADFPAPRCFPPT